MMSCMMTFTSLPVGVLAEEEPEQTEITEETAEPETAEAAEETAEPEQEITDIQKQPEETAETELNNESSEDPTSSSETEIHDDQKNIVEDNSQISESSETETTEEEKYPTAEVVPEEEIFQEITVDEDVYNTSGSDVVAYAKQFLGYPYVGGTYGPNSFDCSGFVQYVFKHFGINLPWSTYSFWNSPSSYGTVVSESNAQPGDVVSWSGHVGIYIGGGQCINALNPSSGVCIIGVSSFTDEYGNRNPAHRYIRINGIDGDGASIFPHPDDFYGYLVLANPWMHLTASAEYPYYPITLASYNDWYNPLQIFHFVKQSDGTYLVSNVYWEGYDGYSWYLSCENMSTAQGTKISLWRNPSPAEKWNHYQEPSGNYYISPQYTDLVLDVTGAVYSPGTIIQLWGYAKGNPAQNILFYRMEYDGTIYSKPSKPSASSYTGSKSVTEGQSVNLTWSTSPKLNNFDYRTYNLTVYDSTGKAVLSRTGLTSTSYNYTFSTPGTYTVQIRAVNSYYRDWYTDGTKSTITVNSKDVAATGIKLDKTSATMATDSTLKLTATVSPTNATNKNVKWTSSNTKVATVDSTGKVTAKTYGKTTITAASVSNPNIKTTCTIQTRFYDVNDSSQYYYKPVYWGTDNDVVVGFNSGEYFEPQGSCTRAQFVTFLWRLAGRPTATGTKVTFKDIKETENYYRAIQWAVSKKIISGYVVDNTFRPDNTVDRASVAIMLWKYAGRPNVNISGRSPFNDISATNCPTLNTYKAVLWGYKNGIIKGYNDGSFKPYANCLREHIVTFLYRYMN